MRAAVPGSSGLPTPPAMIFCATRSFEPVFTSAVRTAYPSIALLSIGGTSIVERCARASTRVVAARGGRSSISPTGFAPARSCARASSTESGPLFMELEMEQDECGDPGIGVQIQQRQFRLHLAAARPRHD